MKMITHPSHSILAASSLAFLIAAIALPQPARADKEDKDKKHKHKNKHEERGDNGGNIEQVLAPQAAVRAIVRAEQGGGVQYRTERTSDYGRRDYYSQPRSNFTISFGEGYRGRGYYYGPPGQSYYNEGPGVSYYPNERVIPREYRSGYGSERGSTSRAVQEALAQRGYYRGSIDGAIGAGSSRAISNFQADYGLNVNGRITPELISTLGL